MMSATMTAGPTRVRITSVALPSEHGGWSLTLEPVLLGLLVAPTAAGALIGAAALFAFLTRTPLKLVAGDRLRGRTHPRTRLATRFALLYGTVTALALLGAAFAGSPPATWWTLAAAAPLFGLQFAYDARARSRRLLPELAGTIGAGAFAASIAFAGGATAPVAMGLWLVMALRSAAAIPFVRVQLLRAKAKPMPAATVDATQTTMIGTAAAGWWFGVIPVSALLALVALGLFHVLAVRTKVPATPIIGAQQVVAGLTVVVATALGVLAP